MEIKKRKRAGRKTGRKGSISVLLSVILLPCLTFTGLMVDYANVIMSKVVVEGAGELVTNAALANYDTVLEDVYGLFAISQNNEELEANLQKYFEDTLNAQGIMPGKSQFASNTLNDLQKDLHDYLGTVTKEDVNRNLLYVEVPEGSFKAKGVKGSQLSKPDVLKNQIVEFMKYRGPAEVGMDMLSSLNAFKLAESKSKVAKSKMDVDMAINDLGEVSKEFYEALVEYDKLMAEYKKQEKIFQEAIDAGLNDTVRKCSDYLVLLSREIIMDNINYVQKKEEKAGEYKYYVMVMESTETGYEDLKGKINKEFIKMEEFQTILDNHSKNIAKLTRAQQLEVYSQFAAYMGSVEVLESMGLKLAKFEEDTYKLTPLAGESAKEYEERQRKEAEKQQEILDEIEKVKEEAWAYQSIYKPGYEALKKEFEDARNYTKEHIPDISTKVRTYYDAAQKLITSTRDKKGWEHVEFWNDGETFLDYSIRLGEEVQKEMDNVQAENTEFMTAIDNYQGEQNKDEYYNIMKSEADKNKETFDKEDVAEILIQLKAGREYVNGADGAIKKLESYIFYTRTIYDGSMDNYEAVVEAAKNELNVEDFDFSKIEEYYNMYFPNKFDTDKEDYHKNFFPKQISEVMPKEIDGVKYTVPPYYLYLASTYGVEKTEEKTGDNLKETATNINEEAKMEAADENADYTYSSDVFDVLKTNNGTDASSSKFEEVKSTNTGILKQFKNMTKTVNNIFKAITGGMENARDNLLVTEYLFQNFSYATYDKQEGFNPDEAKFKTMTMQKISPENNKIYSCEIEYVLKGYQGGTEGWWIFEKERGPEANIAMVKGDIFAVRFVMNSIYALTNSGIDAQTFAPALAIQTATGGLFPYQVVQVVLKLCLSLAETTWDMQQLMDGKKMPLVKTEATWQLSVTNMVEKVAEAAATKATELIVTNWTNISEYLQQSVNHAGDWINENARTVTQNVTESITAATTAALNDALGAMTRIVTDKIQMTYTNIFAKGEKFTNNTKEALKREIKTALKDYAANAPFASDVKEFLTGQVEVVTDSIVDETVSGILAECSKSVEGKVEVQPEQYKKLMDSVAKKIEDYIRTSAKPVREKVDIMTKKLTGEVTTKINDMIAKKSAEGAEVIEEKVSEFLDKKFPSTDVTGGAKNTASSSKLASVFSFGYADYLKLFVFLGLSGDEEAPMLRRITDVIELNVDSGLQEYYKETGISRVEGFTMSKAYTYVEIETEINVPPLLLSQDIFQRGMGKKGMKFFWQYDYRNIAGY